jgi:hypothetical protein
MVCTQCGKELSASSPASTFAQHQKCTNGEEQQQSVDFSDSADENGEPSSAAVHCGVQGARSNQATLPQTVPSAATRARVLVKLALFFFATGTAFCRIENEHLVTMFAFWCVKLCSEKSLAVSTGMKAIYVQVNHGRAHEDVDKELVLSLIVTRWDVVGLNKKVISGFVRVQKAPVL